MNHTRSRLRSGLTGAAGTSEVDDVEDDEEGDCESEGDSLTDSPTGGLADGVLDGDRLGWGLTLAGESSSPPSVADGELEPLARPSSLVEADGSPEGVSVIGGCTGGGVIPRATPPFNIPRAGCRHATRQGYMLHARISP